jgi:hypothetical protein
MQHKKRISISLERRINYIARYWLRGKSAYELGKEIYKKKLTNTGKYKCCPKHAGDYVFIDDSKIFLNP